MNLLVIIGNAAVDPIFRAALFKDSLAIARRYGFQLTKFEARVLKKVFRSENAAKLELAFKALQDALHSSLPLNRDCNIVLMCKRPPCYLSMAAPDWPGLEEGEKDEAPPAKCPE